MTKYAANQTTQVLIAAMPAYERETNLDFAEKAVAGNLKLLEGLLETTPDNEDLLLLTSQNYTRYAFGFIEEKIDIADDENDFLKREKLIADALDFYSRGKKYGIRAIALAHKNFPLVLDQGLEELDLELKAFNQNQVPALFWTAFAWGNIIIHQQDNPERIGEVPKVIRMMQRVKELDETYFFGGAHLFFGVYYGSRPETLGGDPLKAKEHFDRALEICDDKLLMTKFLFVKYYSVPVQNRELFEKTLQEIISAPPDLYPEQGLANHLAKRYAKRWLKRAEKLFL